MADELKQSLADAIKEAAIDAALKWAEDHHMVVYVHAHGNLWEQFRVQHPGVPGDMIGPRYFEVAVAERF